jgi:hypothetical protein
LAWRSVVFFGIEHDWLQWAPVIPGVLWLLLYWCKNRSDWEWALHTPLLVLMSFLTTCYGAWSHDYIMALLPIIQVVVWISCGHSRVMTAYAVLIYIAVDALLLGCLLGGYNNEFFVIWMSPVLILSYFSLGRLHSPALAMSYQ